MENKGTQLAAGIKDMSLSLNKPYIAYSFKKTQKIFQAIYLLTDLMNASEPLRNLMRLNANSILNSATSFLKSDHKDSLSSSNTLIGVFLEALTLLETALMTSLVSENNHSILKGEITRLVEVIDSHKDKVVSLGREFMEVGNVEDYKRHAPVYKGQEPVFNMKDTIKDPVKPSFEVAHKATVFQDRGGRSEKILALFVPNKELMIKDITSQMKEVSEKTIQRELLHLVAKGILKKKGERRWSRYVLK